MAEYEALILCGWVTVGGALVNYAAANYEGAFTEYVGPRQPVAGDPVAVYCRVAGAVASAMNSDPLIFPLGAREIDANGDPVGNVIINPNAPLDAAGVLDLRDYIVGQFGFTVAQIANWFGVTAAQLVNWLQAHSRLEAYNQLRGAWRAYQDGRA